MSYHSVQLPELLTFWGTLRHSVSEDPTHIELLHQKDVSSVSLIADELHFPPTLLSSATQMAPKPVLAPFLSFFTTITSTELPFAATVFFPLEIAASCKSV